MTQALTVHTTFDVDDTETARRAAQVMKHRGGLFPNDMTEAQAAALARLSLLYKLDMLSGELTLFQGHPYLSLLGAVRVANQHDNYRGMTCEPATPAEREAFRARDDEELWIARVYRSDRDVPSVGYGRASRTDDQPVARRWTQEQAQARAKRRALRDAFSLPLPGREEADEREAPAEPAPITPDQTKAIHAASRRAGYSAEQYRARLREMFGRRSSQELTQTQAQAAIAAFTSEAVPTAEERVAARADDPTPEERSFYEKLNAAAAEHQGEEPRFFSPPKDAAAVTSEHDPLWQRWQTLCAEAVAWGVEPAGLYELTLPIPQAALEEHCEMLGGMVAQRKGTHALADARTALRERGRAQQLTVPQLDGLLEHHFGHGVTLATASLDQAHQALALLPADAEVEQEVPLL